MRKEQPVGTGPATFKAEPVTFRGEIGRRYAACRPAVKQLTVAVRLAIDGLTGLTARQWK